MASATPDLTALERLHAAARMGATHNLAEKGIALRVLLEALDEILTSTLGDDPQRHPLFGMLRNAYQAFRASLDEQLREHRKNRDWWRGEFAKLDARLAAYEAERQPRADEAAAWAEIERRCAENVRLANELLGDDPERSTR